MTELKRVLLNSPIAELERVGESAEKASNFAEIIGVRIPRLEPLIARSAKCAYDYARYVIKGRWAEAESVIAMDAECAYYYAHDVIKGRWAEAEPVEAAAGSPDLAL